MDIRRGQCRLVGFGYQPLSKVPAVTTSRLRAFNSYIWRAPLSLPEVILGLPIAIGTKMRGLTLDVVVAPAELRVGHKAVLLS